MNEVVKFITSLATFLQGMWVYFDNKLATLRSDVVGFIDTAKSEAIAAATDADNVLSGNLQNYTIAKINDAKTQLEASTQGLVDGLNTALSTEIDTLEASLTDNINVAKQQAVTDANTAITANNLTITSAYESADAVVLQSSKNYTDAQIQGVSTDVQSAVSLIQQVQVLAANGMIGSILNLGTDESAVLGLIEGAIPEVSGDMVDGNYGIVLSLPNGTDSLTFTRGGSSYTVSAGDFVQVKVVAGAIDTFAVAHDNDNIRIGNLETTKANITYLDRLDTATNGRIDSFKANLNTVMLQAFAGNQDALDIWANSFVA